MREGASVSNNAQVRTRPALALITLLALCGCVSANAATHARTATTPTCKKGQVATKAKPCKAAPVSTADLVPIQDPGDTGVRVGATDAVTIIRYLDPMQGKYQIEVENTSGIGYINTFNWVPPNQMTITAITSSEGGKCSLSNNTIACVGGKDGIAPPKCTCLKGGIMTVNFTATGNLPHYNGSWWTYYGMVGGYLKITSMTPVPYHIPSFLTPELDLPLCAKGKTSTPANPCASS